MTQDKAMQAARDEFWRHARIGQMDSALDRAIITYLSALVEDPEVVITITVCRRSGQLPREACDNGCSTEDIDFGVGCMAGDRAAGGGA